MKLMRMDEQQLRAGERYTWLTQDLRRVEEQFKGMWALLVCSID